uniref:Transposase n=1 Tax=Plectus sambesii TaxID=2011161 RepID=A0A914WR79_9BILA
MDTGSLLPAAHHQNRPAHTVKNVEASLEAFISNPHISVHHAANLFELNKSTVNRTLQDHKFYQYKLQTCQKLFDEDRACRRQFAEDEIILIESDRDHLQNLFFSDEAHFHIYGGVNRQNYWYWNEENPSCYAEEPLYSPCVTVWAAIGEHGIIGPFFFEGNVNSGNYLQLLQNEFWPALHGLVHIDHARFMQDGTPPDWGRAVCEWLSENFGDRWMGRDLPSMPWPARSPDLTPIDFFFWGYVKSKVYTTPIRDLDELRERIVTAIKGITVKTRYKAILGYRQRLHRCLELDGEHVEITYAP